MGVGKKIYTFSKAVGKIICVVKQGQTIEKMKGGGVFGVRLRSILTSGGPKKEMRGTAASRLGVGLRKKRGGGEEV